MDRPFGMFPAHKPGELRTRFARYIVPAVLPSKRDNDPFVISDPEIAKPQSRADLPVVQTTKFELFIGPQGHLVPTS